MIILVTLYLIMAALVFGMLIGTGENKWWDYPLSLTMALVWPFLLGYFYGKIMQRRYTRRNTADPRA